MASVCHIGRLWGHQVCGLEIENKIDIKSYLSISKEARLKNQLD